MDIEVLKDVIASVMKVDKSTLKEDTKFKEDLHCDSIEVYQIIMAMEEKYGHEIPNDKLITIKTIGDAKREIEALI